MSALTKRNLTVLDEGTLPMRAHGIFRCFLRRRDSEKEFRKRSDRSASAYVALVSKPNGGQSSSSNCFLVHFVSLIAILTQKRKCCEVQQLQ